MGRWTQYDEDDYRLPEGMKRVGYDSDTGRYYFRDREGLLYKGPEGSEFGELTQVSELPTSVAAEVDDDNDDLEAAPTRGSGYQPLAVDENGSRHVLRGGPYRTLFPFFLTIAVFLLLIWRLVLLPTRTAPAPCPSTTIPYLVQPGSTCWDIARRHNSTLDRFVIVNPKVTCSNLQPGYRVCVPDEGSSISRVF
ncbi:carbohydrate-binding module family 50 protein [Paxillus involutus ATCC 200175]|uniref:Carbohydrate-binding module family 50 protein n=1 Tax=Paxillus involutus ATCC 200175 TaxID=664439 RepID=A0A0C9TZU6_PAXIN|nr:carbohydrate-binding module family 50 protein [Paxillus involutus ATCC 200175]